MNVFDMQPCAADSQSFPTEKTTRDLRVWRTGRDTHWTRRILALSRFAFLPIISAVILYSWQGFIARVQYFNVVSTSHTSPGIAVTIEKFVRHALGLPPPSPYDVEQQMSSSELMGRWESLIQAASQRFAVPANWVRTVMQMESGGRTMSGDNRPIVSRAGAMGLMQLMPGTYAELRAQYGFGANPFDPHDNVFAGAAYLKWLHGRYGYPALFAAYNDGPGNLEARLARGEKLPLETRSYVSRISAVLGGGKTALGDSGGRVRLVSFTRPNGTRVAIDMNAIVSARAAFPGEYAPGVRSVIKVGGESQGVRETLAVVSASLRSHGARTHTVTAEAKQVAPNSFRKRVSVSYSMQARHCRAACAKSAT